MNFDVLTPISTFVRMPGANSRHFQSWLKCPCNSRWSSTIFQSKCSALKKDRTSRRSKNWQTRDTVTMSWMFAQIWERASWNVVTCRAFSISTDVKQIGFDRSFNLHQRTFNLARIARYVIRQTKKVTRKRISSPSRCLCDDVNRP
jgi:hypothetical protein